MGETDKSTSVGISQKGLNPVIPAKAGIRVTGMVDN